MNSRNKIDMALMHPEDIEDLESATAGEKKVFRFLHEVTRPDKDLDQTREQLIRQFSIRKRM